MENNEVELDEDGDLLLNRNKDGKEGTVKIGKKKK